MNDISQLSRILEGALFAANKPLSIAQMLTLFPEEQQPEKAALKDALTQLQEDYEKRGIELKELGSGYQFQVCPDLSQWVSRLWEERAPRYSRALLETLALVAYRQPITRGEIEEVRGVVVSTNIMRTLVEREWVRVVGHKDVPGRPSLYATTKLFLDYFGLARLEDLPPLSELTDLETLGKKLEQQLESGETTAEAEADEHADDTGAEATIDENATEDEAVVTMDAVESLAVDADENIEAAQDEVVEVTEEVTVNAVEVSPEMTLETTEEDELKDEEKPAKD